MQLINTQNSYEICDYMPFSKQVLDQARVASRIKTSSYLSKRSDLRGRTLLTFSESPDSLCECALSFTRKNGKNSLGIHISDVAEYVVESSPLDTEARARRATIRFGNSVSEMLPHNLTTDIFDLAVGSDKLALSVLLDIDDNGELISVNFEESVIRVAQKCVYCELDRVGLATDTSSVFALREKYGPYMGTLYDMYELAATLCAKRREKGGLDCTVFKHIFEVNEDNKAVSFSFAEEPDSKTMIREIGYFAAEVIGKYMLDNKIPSIYIGQDTIPENKIDFLAGMVGANNAEKEAAARVWEIAELAKGSEHYEAVCIALKQLLPAAKFSDKPIYNTLCATDTLVSVFRPATRYADLLALRTLKSCVDAKGNAGNLNLNRHTKNVKEAAEEASRSESFVFLERNRYIAGIALEYLTNSNECVYYGFPVLKNADGSFMVYLFCGAQATIPPQHADDIHLNVGTVKAFELLELDGENDNVFVKPIA
jgi:ribonuclease R